MSERRAGTGTGTGTGTWETRRDKRPGAQRDRMQPVVRLGRREDMVLDHERLDVYLVALDFVVFANEVIERLPRGRSHLADAS